MLGLAWVGVCVIALLGGGFFVWHSQHAGTHLKTTSSLADGTASINETSNPAETSTDNAVDSAGSLNVSSGGASNLGQLGASSGNGQSGAASQSGTAASGSSSQAVNPATFSEYDKYKASTNALFGDVQVGTGDELTVNKQAAVLYKGWLTDGSLFDESRAGSDGKLQPVVFTLGAHQVIPGWEEGMAGMKVGGTRLIIVPPSVGYGAAGQGSVPGNSVMVFEVQLLAVK